MRNKGEMTMTFDESTKLAQDKFPELHRNYNLMTVANNCLTTDLNIDPEYEPQYSELEAFMATLPEPTL
jgi:hypothetical protein